LPVGSRTWEIVHSLAMRPGNRSCRSRSALSSGVSGCFPVKVLGLALWREESVVVVVVVVVVAFDYDARYPVQVDI
jgi:hypothetical protein